MDEKVYGYMDWPRIEAIVYGEETAPRDVMGPRITQDGVLIQGFFPDAEEVSVISGKKTYVCEKEDEAGYFAVLLPVRKVPEYRFLIKMGETEKECYDPYAFPFRGSADPYRCGGSATPEQHLGRLESRPRI